MATRRPDGSIPSRRTTRSLERLARVAAACNDASLHAPATSDDPWTISGDPTEAALLALAAKLEVDPHVVAAAWPRVEELTFDPERRRMATIHTAGAEVWVAVKGALEAIGPLLDATEADLLRQAEHVAERYAADGYRVLAFAERTIDDVPARLDDAEHGLHLLGIVGMADPPREASAPSIAACRAAGITPIMITGDHPLTANAIARRIGVLRDGGRSLTGAELEQLDDAAFDAIVADVAVYARTNPEQKLRIVDAWRRRGAVVSMTGDGVNDAPALRRADIGVAMGVTGTEVSKEAADMVLADDDFATIVAAVEEGRRIYDNIRRFVRYLLTTNSAEIWVMTLAPFLGLPFPLLAVQILWVNLVTDGLPALALGVEPTERGTMRRPPRSPSESLFARGLWQHTIWVGLLMASVALAVQAYAIGQGWPWQTMVFATLALLQLGHALAIRSETDSLFRLGLRSNLPLTIAVAGTFVVQMALIFVPALQPIFGTVALTAAPAGIGPGRLDPRFRGRRGREVGRAPDVRPARRPGTASLGAGPVVRAACRGRHGDRAGMAGGVTIRRLRRSARTIRTETPACRSTFRETLPRSHRSRPCRHREPVTTRSTWRSAAAAMISLCRVPGPNLRFGRDPILREPCGHRRGVPLVALPQFLAVGLERQAAQRVQATINSKRGRIDRRRR